jgi:phosphonate transport system substrate-binding protein
MTKRAFQIAGLTLLFSLAFTACNRVASTANTPTPDSSFMPQQGGIIVLGDISDDPGEVIEGTQPLADYLARQLADYGISTGVVRVATSADEMTAMLESGEVDIYFDSIYPATLVHDQIGATPFLRRWRFGVEEYHSVIFTSVESGITAIDQLAGKTIAFDSPYSTSGYLLPAVTILESGLTLGPTPGSGQVGIAFSFDDENTLQWVLTGRVDAGATDDFNWEVVFEDVRDELLLLAVTDSVPRQVAVARSGIDPELLAAITEILTTMHETEEGRAALEPFQTTQFDEFPEGIEDAIDRIREMIERASDIQLP